MKYIQLPPIENNKSIPTFKCNKSIYCSLHKKVLSLAYSWLANAIKTAENYARVIPILERDYVTLLDKIIKIPSPFFSTTHNIRPKNKTITLIK